ncbi:polysaccharide deacetylase family protein [Limobrevibacterium gyesilva]|uniref:WalW protein n=1 Tax=Limobrevibacterium gyesilva TaxID=2991712 RepID=A0AA41YN20_9PROT|nr:hypothetical protein [Limobrevibacterium gyesilva]MCW3476924.1 hypothetical protein [Limobrevibacterium gyesilva]
MKSRFFAATTPAVTRQNRPVCTLVIDAEEDFDWDVPIQGTLHSTAHMKNVRVLHGILSSYGIVPAYLLTYPVLEDPDVVRIVRRQLEQEHCAAGVQLHPWVTPPFDDVMAHRTSFSGNLEANFEERKLLALKAKFREVFGFEPTVYRSGRYGLSSHTGRLLEKHGFLIDTSVAPRTNFTVEGGPDYSDHDYELFWFGEQRDLLEIPLCRSIVGWAGPLAPALYHGLSGPRLSGLHVPSVLTRSRCAERITLSPEGNDVAAMRRLLLGLLARGQDVFALSFHSSSLQAGRNPYVRTKAELHGFYDRLSEILDFMASALAVRFASILEIPGVLDRPARRAAPA